ncbi:hypothetical protein [Spiroplasma endosymbiont of Diplazon laetatorius]|uniref:hypothetical protein n=1 Tax=Spiroplasma endosymbiont of Diplazon laetatorius TaxID=3066322 RepID=UPI0030CE7787
MKKIKTIDIATCGVITAIMFSLGVITVTLSNFGGENVFQISDIFYLVFLNLLNPFLIIFSAILSGVLTDVYAGGVVYIPVTILVKLLIGITFTVLKKILPIYITIFISYLWVFVYVLFTYILFDKSFLILEAIIDSIQYSVNTFFACIVYFSTKRFYSTSKVFKNNEKPTKILAN